MRPVPGRSVRTVEQGAVVMKRFVPLAAVVVVALAAAASAQEMPQPVKEHGWLKQFVGEWEVASEIHPGPGVDPIKCKGSESVKQIGGFWIVSELKSEIKDMPMNAVMTVGYDPTKKRYIGSWIDSMSHVLWHYDGSVDDDGKTLTLEADGPNMVDPTKTSKYRDVTEFKSPDHRVLTSYVQDDDGKWVAFMTAEFHRKK
jgi:hypothetical protein